MRFIPVIVVWIICIWLGFALLYGEKPSESPMVGRDMPALSLPNIENETPISLAELVHGKISIVHFFASWCVPCQSEHKTLLKLHEKNIIPIIGIAWKNKPAEATIWLAKLGSPYDFTLYDMQGISTVPFGLTGVPETFVVGTNGKILYHSKSILTDEVIAHDIMPLIKGAK